jgi:putative sterol carrier protein
MPPTITDLMLNMPKAFIPENAAGIDAVIQFKFTGEETGEWFATIKDGKCVVEQGLHPSPTTTLKADSGEYIKIVTGELNGMQAYIQGKIEVTRDLTVAMNLMRMFK